VSLAGNRLFSAEAALIDESGAKWTDLFVPTLESLNIDNNWDGDDNVDPGINTGIFDSPETRGDDEGPGPQAGDNAVEPQAAPRPCSSLALVSKFMGLRELSCRRCGLTSLAGLEALPLRTLNAADNRLADLPHELAVLRRLSDTLEELTLVNNPLCVSNAVSPLLALDSPEKHVYLYGILGACLRLKRLDHRIVADKIRILERGHGQAGESTLEAHRKEGANTLSPLVGLGLGASSSDSSNSSNSSNSSSSSRSSGSSGELSEQRAPDGRLLSPFEQQAQRIEDFQANQLTGLRAIEARMVAKHRRQERVISIAGMRNNDRSNLLL
jgi:hypothetical protein